MNLWEEAPKISLFGLQVYSFGLYCAIGAVAAVAAIAILCRAMKMKKGSAPALSFLCLFFGLAGSRLFFCLLNHPGLGGVPFLSWFRISIGGYSMFGMILGTFFGAWICSLVTREKKGTLLDITACAIPLMIAAERFGEKLFGEFNISRPLSENLLEGTFLAVYDSDYGSSFLATYLVSAILSLVLFFTLIFFLSRTNREDGDIWNLFLLLCGAGGIFLESLRYDYHLEYSFVYLQQVISALMLIWGVTLAGKGSRGPLKKMYRAALISVIPVIGICGGIEYALDKVNVSHILLYVIMAAVLSVPVVLGIVLLRSKEKGPVKAE